jgi:FdhE protein
VIASYDEILLALRSEAEKRPQLADLIQLYCAVLEAQARAEPEPPSTALSAQKADERLGQGRALLSPEDVQLDAPKLAELCAEIGFTIAQHRRELVKPLAQIHAWLYERRQQVGALAVEYLREGLARESEEAGLRSDLLSLVFREALRPFLRAQARALGPLVDDSRWYRAFCPVCGGEPDLAALQPGAGQRRLLCSRCDSEWTFTRVACAFCDNDDPRQLAYYPSEDRVYRLNVCERCRRYLKTIDLREVAGERLLPAERVLTLAMDLAARNAGYRDA